MPSMRAPAQPARSVVFLRPRKSVAFACAAALLVACATATGQTATDGASESGGLLDVLKKAADQLATSIKDGVTGNYQVRGTVPLARGQTLTCFTHLPSGLISNGGPITDPSQGQGAPLAVMTAKGEVVGAECDKLAQQGILVPWLPPGGGTQAARRNCGVNAEGVSYTPDGRMVLNHDANCNGTNVMANGTVNCKLNVDGTPVGKYDKSDDPRIGSVVKQTARASHCIETQRQQAMKEVRAEQAAAAGKR